MKSKNAIKIGISNDSVPDVSIVDTSDPDAAKEIVESGEIIKLYVNNAFENSGVVRTGGFVKRECYFECNKDVSIGFKITVNYFSQVKYRDGFDISSGLNKGMAFYYSKVRYGDRQGVDIQKSLDYSYLKGWEVDPTVQGDGEVFYKGDGNFILELPNYSGNSLEIRIRMDQLDPVTIKKYVVIGELNIIYVPIPKNPLPWRLAIYENGIKVRTKINLYEALDEITPEIVISTDIQKIQIGKYYFDQLIFEKSIQDQTEIDFIYGVNTNITPIFPLTGIGIGDNVTPDLILSNQVNQSSFLRAVKQMFNLNFYTDIFKKIVFIEPRDDFYSGPIIDWSDKIDLSKPIVIEELGSDIGRIFSIGYGEPDYTVKKFNEDNKTTLGTFKEKILNLFAKTETETHENEMFYPSIVKSGAYPPAESAKLLHVNDNDNNLVVNPDTRAVKYLGTQSLQPGETIEFPAGTTQYPVVAFSSDGVNLGFEDRNNEPGLHKYYDRNIRMYNKSKLITCYLHLRSVDIEPFAKLNPLKEDFRAKFKLMIDNEYIFCNLEEISDFKNERSSTKCVFVKRV